VKVERNLDLATLLPTLPVKSLALGAWRLDDYWVTAVMLQNQTTQRITLEPRELMGEFVYSAFQLHYIGSRVDDSDTTTFY
ncbi:DUF3438 family protein, partial [Pseudomonas syringae pv. tagetis]|uniref:DUF3438 family protein n=1 Tax=Pseudomonas syringae group genomosp. 7 TaxID=251699 RepID=UPI00376FA719